LGNVLKSIRIKEIRERRKDRLVVIMLSVFGDESHDEKQQRIFVVAGVAASQEVWDAFTPVWIDRLGGKIFHAAQCEAGRGEFKGMSKEERSKLHKDLAKILARANIIGLGIGIDILAYRDIFPDVPRYMCYYMCFVPLVLLFGTKASEIDPQQKSKFYFDQNPQTDSHSLKLYDHMINFPEVRFSSYFDEISIADRKQVGIQCADLFAREVMKDIDNRHLGGIKYNIRKSWKILFGTHSFVYLYRNREWLLSLKKKYENLNQPKLGEWLAKRKLANNIENRIKYVIHLRERKGE